MTSVRYPPLFQQNVIKLEQALPVIGHRVIAVCKKFQQLGFLDSSLVWRDAFRPAEEMSGVIGWYEV